MRHNENEFTEAAVAWRFNVVLWCFTHFSTLLFLVWFLYQCFSPPLTETHIIILPWDAHLPVHHLESKPFILLLRHPSRPWQDSREQRERKEQFSCCFNVGYKLWSVLTLINKIRSHFCSFLPLSLKDPHLQHRAFFYFSFSLMQQHPCNCYCLMLLPFLHIS